MAHHDNSEENEKPGLRVNDYEKPREGTITMLTKHSEGEEPLREATHEHTKLLQHGHRLTHKWGQMR